MAFLNPKAIEQLGLKSCGTNVLISDKASIYSPEQISIGSNVRIDDFCILSGQITLGDYIHIAAYSALYGKFGIEMESFTGLSPRCTIFSASDDFSGHYLISPMVPEQFTEVTGGLILIKRLSQIGAGTIIMPNITINEGVAVGAMSFVNIDLQEWGIYAGVPARKINERDRTCAELAKKFR